MREADVLFLAIYIIVVIYVLNQMIESIDDQITITVDEARLKEQLVSQNIDDKVGIAFKLRGRYELNHPKELGLVVKNKSEADTIHVNWDDCSLVGYDGRSRRVIRLTPNLIRDLAQPQVDSVIAPGKSLDERITAEDVLVRDDLGSYNPSKTIIDISKLKKVPKLFASFDDRNLALNLSLRLIIRISQLSGGVTRSDRLYSVDCPFSVKKLPWTYALPWNK